MSKLQSQNKRKKVFTLIAVIGSIFLSFLLSELLLRVIYKAPLLTAPVNSLQNHGEYGIFNVPNYEGIFRTSAGLTHIKINAEGLRDHERNIEKDRSTLRILALGDSYVWGHGVEFDDLFLSITELKLKKYLSSHFDESLRWTNADVVKVGVGGWGPANQLAFLKNEGDRYDPDVVVLCFFTGNDYADSLDPYQFAEYEGVRILRTSKLNITWKRRMHLWGRKHLFTYGLVADIGKWIIKGRKDPNPEDVYFLNNCRVTQSERRTHEENTTFTIVNEFKRYCAEKKYSFYVLILPSRIEFDENWAREIMKKYKIKNSEIDLDLPTRKIRDYCEKNSIIHFEFLPVARKEVKNGLQGHFVSDSHYSPALHSVLGEFLFQKILVTINNHGLDSKGEQSHPPDKPAQAPVCR